MEVPFDWDVFVFFNFSLFGDVFDLFFWDVLWDVLPEIFNGIVIGDCNFPWDFLNDLFLPVFGDGSFLGDSFNSSLILVFDYLFLEGHILDSAFTLDHFFSCVDDGVDNLGFMALNIRCNIA